MNVSACLVTRGDVDLQPIIDSLPITWEVVIWDNSGTIQRSDGWAEVCHDLSVYGRYAAIEYASNSLIYTQDDDVIVSDPQAIVDAWEHLIVMSDMPAEYKVVCNMPPEFRPHYPDSGLVGFGAVFNRYSPDRAFRRYLDGVPFPETDEALDGKERDLFHRECDRIFTVLTPRVLVDIPKEDCAYASDPNRMWRSPDHIGERDRMIALARQVRDGG